MVWHKRRTSGVGPDFSVQEHTSQSSNEVPAAGSGYGLIIEHRRFLQSEERAVLQKAELNGNVDSQFYYSREVSTGDQVPADTL
jgi:hypothetical protein